MTVKGISKSTVRNNRAGRSSKITRLARCKIRREKQQNQHNHPPGRRTGTSLDFLKRAGANQPCFRGKSHCPLYLLLALTFAHTFIHSSPQTNPPTLASPPPRLSFSPPTCIPSLDPNPVARSSRLDPLFSLAAPRPLESLSNFSSPFSQVDPAETFAR